MTTIINTREDLDNLEGTPAYTEFMNRLKTSMTRTVDTQEYPEGYGQFDYQGAKLEPIWSTIKDLSLIEQFGFTEADFK